MADLRTRIGEAIIGRGVTQELGMLREEARISQANGEILQERMAELELALEDANWMRLMLTGEQEFSRAGLKKICELARLMFIKNPLIKRSVLVQALYVWAQGVTVRAKDPRINAVIQAFWDDEKNRTELTSHQARFLKEIDLQVEGNLFFVFFTRPTDGRVWVRTIPVDEITEIISDPEDAKSPWYYVRTWTEKTINLKNGRTSTKTQKAYYPDWRYRPEAKPPKIGKDPVKWDAPVHQVKDGGLSGWKFGVSQVYAGIDWARAYKEFLEDWSSLTRSYSRFAWKMTSKGGKRGVAAAKEKLGTTLASGGGTGAETNPPPVTGSTFIASEGTDMQPFQLRGANVSAEDGRRLLLMVAANAGLPETYYGDVSVGTLATGKTLDRPTELMMRNRQSLWMDVLRDIINYVILQAAKSTSNPINKIAKVATNEDEEKVTWTEGVDPHLDIDFPPILERDVTAMVQAIVTAATLNGQQLAIFDEPIVARLLLSALAQDDVDELMIAMYPDETAAANSGEPTPSEARIREAARRLAEAIKKIKHEGHNGHEGEPQKDENSEQPGKKPAGDASIGESKVEEEPEETIEVIENVEEAPEVPPISMTLNITNQMPEQPTPVTKVENKMDMTPVAESIADLRAALPAQEQTAPVTNVETNVDMTPVADAIDHLTDAIKELPAPVTNITNEVKIPEPPARKITLKKDGNKWKGEAQ